MLPNAADTDHAPIAEGVSDLYKQYPYPAHGVIGSVVARMLDEIVPELQGRLGRKQLNYLDAGCGTGEQTLGVARRFPDLHVTGVDLNDASLELARTFATRNRLEANFMRRSLMDPLEGIGAVDIVTSIGVLHSLPDPEQGFRVLRQASGPDTMFVGMVYGTFGKWDMFQVRDALGLLCDEMPREDRLAVLAESCLATNHGPGHYARVLRDRIKYGPRIAPLEALRRVVKGRNEAYQADSYTHVQEVTYRWSELIDLLDRTGWKFLGWPKRSGMPDDPRQLFSGRALRMIRTRTLAEQAAIYERLVRPPNLFFVARPKN